MKTTKKVTLSSMAVALSAVILLVGSFFEIAEFAVGSIASLIMLFVLIEMRAPYTWLVWLATSLISVLLYPSKMAGIAYFLVFGLYPILKMYFEKLPKVLAYVLKIVYINGAVSVIVFLAEFITGVPFFEDGIVWYFTVAAYVVANAAFILYDIFLAVMSRAYVEKYRQKFRNFLK